MRFDMPFGPILPFEPVTRADELLTAPYDADREALADVDELLIIGARGKMGPSLLARARRAAPHARILGVARSGSDVSADLLDRRQIEALPDSKNVIFLAGRKFGSTGNEGLTWATNVLVPAYIAERYRDARMVALSSGNVYPLTGNGATERTAPAPIGEYAQSVLARERMFEYFSGRYGTRAAILRLNYAIDVRYGVLLDIGRRVFEREPVSVAMGKVNVIWQGDANSVVLRSLRLADSPPFLLNVTGPTVRVRDIADGFGRAFGIEPEFEGTEAETALLSDASLCARLLGAPRVSLEEMIALIAEWIQEGGATHNKPTHFEVRDGRF
jgi:nucleoside-diphosphate-sugar epimerase